MMRSLWIAKTGLEAQQTQMDVISNNLANVGTNGFKRSRAVFEDLMYQTIRQPGASTSEQSQLPSGLQLGTGVKPVATERIHMQGNLKQTSNPTDLAIQGQGFLQVQMPDGSTAYTRDGTLQVDSQGRLVTSSGFPLNPPVTIPPNATSVAIGRDGTVSITQTGSSTSTQIGSIQLATFSNPTGLLSAGENLFAETNASGQAQTATPGTNGAGTLAQGYVETSNVSVVEELVNMIQAQRAYEINSKAIQASDQMLQRLAQL
jgi:flagellar basal-body rod protein FlgG